MCQREVCLPAAEAILPSHSMSLHNLVYSTIWYEKNIYASVKYVYEAPKNGQTIVICSTATRGA